MKPHVFVGSSTEGLEIARAVQSNLESAAEVTVWSQNVFLPGEHTLESLLRIADRSDFGVFVFSSDDIVEIRESLLTTVRDNVIFELGLCIGRLGAKRSFIVMPRVSNFRIPSDLNGINAATFDPPRADRDLVSAVGPACTKIRTALKTPNEYPLEPELRMPVLLRRDALTPNMQSILNHIERYEPCTRIDLESTFNLGDSELFYRTQYLRLLSLVAVDDPVGDFQNAVFRAHPDYVAARNALPAPVRRHYSSSVS